MTMPIPNNKISSTINLISTHIDTFTKIFSDTIGIRLRTNIKGKTGVNLYMSEMQDTKQHLIIFLLAISLMERKFEVTNDGYIIK